MRRIAILLMLSLGCAIGCSPEATTASKPTKLEVVDATTLQMLKSSKPVILLDFAADY